MPSSARLTVAADAAAATTASEWVRALGARLGLGERDLYRLDLCVTELVTNIASYAYADRDGAIELLALDARADGAVRIEIVDDGSPFDPLAFEPPAAREGADIPIGGHGIALVRGFADECSYERRGPRNVFAFTIKRGSAGAA
jgi:anti-sigma regulatory factor (Ser/Thr protein kinase)